MGEATFGKYRLIAELGHGGMADVFLAVIAGPVGSGFSKLTVIKRLRQNLADEPEFVEMLVDEARISARLNHPNVVQTNEVGSVGNQYFLAMEYLDGQPLHRIQHRATQRAQKALAEKETTPPPSLTGPGRESTALLATDPFPVECQYVVILDTLAGLQHAHDLVDYDGSPLGIVHRDVTPHNVFVTYEGQVKVVDFGIAKAAGRASETRQGVVKGKVRYMAPEQAVGQPVDRRADVFSVGIMLWEAATGRRLWKDMDDLNIVQALVGGTMQISPRSVNPSVPEEIDRICQKALAYKLDDRYATAEDFRADLEQYLAETGKLVSARRKLGPAVSDLFIDKRTEIKGVIEKQLAQMSARGPAADIKTIHIPVDSSSGTSNAIPPSGPTRPSATFRTPSVNDANEAYTGTGTSTSTDSKDSSRGSRKSRRRPASSRVPALAAAAVLVVATGVFASTRGRSFLSKNGNAENATSTAAVPEQPAEVRVMISTNPPGARVTVDGVLLAHAADTTLARDRRAHRLRVEAPGYEAYEQSVHLENDLPLAIVLTPTTTTTAKGAPSTVAVAATAASPRWTPQAPPPTTKATPVQDQPAPVTVTTATPAPSPSHKVKPPIDQADPWSGAAPK